MRSGWIEESLWLWLTREAVIMSDKDRIAALEAKLAASDDRIRELERRLNPTEPAPALSVKFERIDWTERMSLPPSAIEAANSVVPKGFMQDVRRDNHISQNQSMVPKTPQDDPPPGGGFLDPVPVRQYPDMRYIDQMLDAQDARDLKQRLKDEPR
jgi:hypothetical protein